MDSNKGGSIDASGQVLVDCGVGSRSQVKTFLKKASDRKWAGGDIT